MTVGGITAAFLLIVGGLWLSSELDAEWPFYAALAIIGLNIAWRVFDYLNYRRQVSAFNDAFDLKWATEEEPSTPKPTNAPRSTGPQSQHVTGASKAACNNYLKRGDGHCANCGEHWYAHNAKW